MTVEVKPAYVIRLNDHLNIFLFGLPGNPVDSQKENSANIRCRCCNSKDKDEYFDVRLSTTGDRDAAVHLFYCCRDCVFSKQDFVCCLGGYMVGAILTLVGHIHSAPMASLTIKPE